MTTENTTLQSLTWRELKEHYNQINEGQLDEVVRWWGDERGGMVGRIWILEEEYVSQGYGFEPISVHDNPEDEDFDNTIDEGTPIIWVD